MYGRYFNTEQPIQPSRRTFLKLTGAVGASLTLGLQIPGASVHAADTISEFVPNAFLRIDHDSRVTVIIKHLEMGQGTYTGLATLVAEELDADWQQVHCEGAPADASRYANLLWGQYQGTGGSSAIANSFTQMRQAGAAARKMLIDAAAAEWQVDADDISIEKGRLQHAEKNLSAEFGDLIDTAAKQAIPDPELLDLKEPSQFKLIGRTLPRKDVGKNNGTAVFTQDVKLPGMLTALVAHPPKFGATVKAFDDKQAKTVSGIVDVVEIPTGVAVLASDYWSAKKARDQLTIEWDESQAFQQSSEDLFKQFHALSEEPGVIARQDGDTESALSTAEKSIEASFEFPFLAHAAMEPLNCVALVNDDGCEIWNGEQIQSMDQYAVATALGIAPEKVKINMLFAGGSFGRRANPASDYVLEAVSIARTQPGTPVKLVWSREDDTRAGYYRPMYVHKVRAAIDKEGKPLAWHHRIVGQSILTGTAFESMLVKDGIDGTSVEGVSDLPYSVPNLYVDLHTVPLPVPVLWWRSVGHSHTAYSTEIIIDELAHAAGADPLDYRLQLLDAHPRYQGVLKLAAEKADWGKPLPDGQARGISVHKSFRSYVAQVAEVAMVNGKPKLQRVVCAVDCGVAVNPDVIRAQMEGGIGFGLSQVWHSEISFDQGAVKQSNFHDYQVLRMADMPEIDVHIVPSAEPPTGVGEPGVPPIAAAVGNALYSLTGKRHYRLPIRLI